MPSSGPTLSRSMPRSGSERADVECVEQAFALLGHARRRLGQLVEIDFAGRVHMGDEELPVTIVQEDRPDAERDDDKTNVAQEEQEPVLGARLELEFERAQRQAFDRLTKEFGIEGQSDEPQSGIEARNRNE